VGEGTLTGLLSQLARQLEPAFATEVDVDQRDVWPELGDLPTRLGRGPGSPDDIETLFGEQTVQFLSEARVVINDQATQTHKASRSQERPHSTIGASPQNELEGSLPPASVKTKVGGWPQAQLGAGRADTESVLGDAAPALNAGPQIMELRHFRHFAAGAEKRHSAGPQSDRTSPSPESQSGSASSGRSMFVELDTRRGDGLNVTLEWDRDSGQTQIVLHDVRADTMIVFGVPPANAADAFRHPFRYVP
jgi:hypothetical protein